jgi:CspA family cold shock protein
MNFGALPLVQPSESLSINGLPIYLTDEQLQAVFSQYGTVEQCKMLDIIPGLLTRAALVTMATMEEAAWLVQHLNGNIPSGLDTPVTVQYLAPSVPEVAFPALDPAALQALAALTGFPALAALATPLPAVPAAAPVQTFQVGVSLNGTVKRWDDQKGFGFIVPDGGGPDVFVHIGDLNGGHKLVNGSQVVFEAMQDPSKGPGRYRAKTVSGGIPKESPIAEACAITDNLFITGLPLDITEETVKDIFTQYGGVISVKKLPNQPGKSDAATLVRMGSAEQAEWMVKNVSSNIPTGLTTPVHIRYAENKGQGAPRLSGARSGPY